MAERNKDVMDMVREALLNDPETDLDALFDRARRLDPAIGELNKRQFHAQYPLQVKRTLPEARRQREKKAPKPAKRASRGRRGREESPGAPATGAPAASTRAPSAARESIREILTDLAHTVAGAESRADLVRVLRGIDGYVERVEGLLAPAGAGEPIAAAGKPRRRRG